MASRMRERNGRRPLRLQRLRYRSCADPDHPSCPARVASSRPARGRSRGSRTREVSARDGRRPAPRLPTGRRTPLIDRAIRMPARAPNQSPEPPAQPAVVGGIDGALARTRVGRRRCSGNPAQWRHQALHGDCRRTGCNGVELSIQRMLRVRGSGMGLLARRVGTADPAYARSNRTTNWRRRRSRNRRAVRIGRNPT